MRRTFHYFDRETGVFSPRTFTSGSEEIAKRNAPTGHDVIEGEFDFLSQKVDLSTLKVIDYQPPQPSMDHEWNAKAKRWRIKAAVAQARQNRVAAQAEIERLERKQARRVRELLAANDPQLRAIDEEIAGLRANLAGGQ